MSNSFLSPTAITKESLRVLHNNLTFAKTANRMYDKQFANSGATMSGKVGPTLTIRKPNRYTVRTGATINVQDMTEPSTTFTVSTQKGIDFTFSSADLTLTIDEFSSRYLKPAMAALAAKVDSDGLALYKDMYNSVGTAGTGPNAASVILASKVKLDDNCAPSGDRYCCMSPSGEATLVGALTSFFQSSERIKEQYEKGAMGVAFGYDFRMDQQVARHTAGTHTASGEVTVSAADQTGATITLTNSGNKTVVVGDVFTMAGCYAVNPESKATLSSLQMFTCTTAGTTSVGVSPSISITGPTQNCSAAPTNGGAVVFQNLTASDTRDMNMAYHKDAFALVTADLVLPGGVDFAAREVYDGISIRIVRQYDINNDTFPCRCDILYGWKTLYPEWACRITG